MILVDELKEYDNGPRGHRWWCHMMTDDLTDTGLAELHAMATRIGLKRAYFQNKGRLPHYDLTPSKRTLAVRCGAQEVSGREMVTRCVRGSKLSV